jgi:hypothetical protein
VRASVIGVALAVAAASGLSACDGSSSTHSRTGMSSSPAASPAGSSSSSAASKPSAQPGGLTNALLRSGSPPHATAVVCLAESASERARSPFGTGGAPVYACTLTVSGAHVAYDVQLLHSGCFVAERRRPGKAIYGCGAGRP